MRLSFSPSVAFLCVSLGLLLFTGWQQMQLHRLSAIASSHEEEERGILPLHADRRRSLGSGRGGAGGGSSLHGGTEGGGGDRLGIGLPLRIPRTMKAGQCNIYPRTEFWGDAVDMQVGEGGVATTRKASSAAECCAHCSSWNDKVRRTWKGGGGAELLPCTVFVWCGETGKCGKQFQECWLKHVPYPGISVPKATGEGVPWTSGTLDPLDITDWVFSHAVAKLRRQARSLNLTLIPLDTKGDRGEEDAGVKAGGGEDRREGAGTLDDDTTIKASQRKHFVGRSGPPSPPDLLPDVSLVPLKRGVKSPQMYHTITSMQGTYNQWQMRIHYYHWSKMKDECQRKGHGTGLDGRVLPCEMGGFTRLLHSGKPDNLMDEIPTVVVEPMPDSLLKHDDYVVLNRPYAFVEWAKNAKIPERYVLMAEPDHIFLRPLPNFMRGDRPAAFNFGYMDPAQGENRVAVMRHTGIKRLADVDQVVPIGNSPTFLTLEDMKIVMPRWLNLSMEVYKDKASTKVWGWVQEMYAFTMAMWGAGLKEVDLIPHMMAQPPWDMDWELTPGHPFYILHYTYGLDFNTTTGEALFSSVGEWHWCKRDWQVPIPRNIEEPPPLIDSPLGRELIRSLNEATAAIPCWEEYRASRGSVVTKECGEKSGGYLAKAAASATTATTAATAT